MLRQVFESSGGNPLFGLELGRMLEERGTPQIGEDMPIPDLVEEAVGARVARLSPGVRMLVLAVALSPDMAVSELTAIAGPEAVAAAIEADALAIDGGKVRVAHPLLAAAAR